MLRIIAEFDHIQIVVGGQHQLALCPAAHASNLLDRDYRHRIHRCALPGAASSSILEPPRWFW